MTRTPISAAPLPPTQAQVVAALAKGQTITAEAGVHRTAIYHWSRNEPHFLAAIEKAQQEYAAALSDELRELSALALATLRSLLDDPATPPSIRLRAALAVLERPQFPNPGWTLPERIESPQKQQVLDDLAEIEADHKRMRTAESTPAGAKREQSATEPSGPQHPTTNPQRPLLRLSVLRPVPAAPAKNSNDAAVEEPAGVIGSRDAHSSGSARAA